MRAPIVIDPATSSSQLSDAIRTVREIVEKRLRTYRMAARDEMFADLGRMQALELGIEELNVLWEELEGQSDRLAFDRQRYAALFNQAPDAYLVTDSNGKIVEANRAASELLCAAPAHLAGKLLVRFIPPEERQVFRAHFRAAVMHCADRESWRARLQRADGTRVGVEFAVGGATHPGTGALLLCWLVRA